VNYDTTELAARLTELAREAHPALLTGCRAITPGDEFALTDFEAASFSKSVASVRRASGAARIAARALLSQLGSAEIPRSVSGAPCWPPTFVGSMSHDSDVAVAAVAAAAELLSVGIDVEPAQPLPPELLDLVATPFEQNKLRGDLLAARQLFCIKEAVFKACNPLDGQFLDYHDIVVQFNRSLARTRTGRALVVQTSARPRILALTVVLRHNTELPDALGVCDG
jgi:4'-phosphopantetheinyl transferase EntD